MTLGRTSTAGIDDSIIEEPREVELCGPHRDLHAGHVGGWCDENVGSNRTQP